MYPYFFGYQLLGAACTEISPRLLWLAMPGDWRSDLAEYPLAPQAPLRHDVVGVIDDVRPGSCAYHLRIQRPGRRVEVESLGDPLGRRAGFRHHARVPP